VTPLVLDVDKKHWIIGLLWGIGHLIGMLFIGVLYLLFKEQIPIEHISEFNEQIVGIILILLGVWSIFKIYFDKKKHFHPHLHNDEDNYIHVHEHHHHGEEDSHEHHHEKVKKLNSYASFGIGIIHGFAGVAHFILLLPILTLSKGESILYILGFGLGSVISMTLYAILLGKISSYSKIKDSKNLHTIIRVIGGALSIIVGIWWLIITW